MQDLAAFRVEARAWLEKEVPQGVRGKAADIRWAYGGGKRGRFVDAEHEKYVRLMVERGWTAPDWPSHYGGGGLTKKHAAVLREELGRLGLPTPLQGMGLSMIGPTLLNHGTEAQRVEHLPKITSGAIRWAQGYSEPNAGSDLASLQTSARLMNGRYVINGQKVWTTGANFADWMFLLVRTSSQGSKHLGITFILMDLDQPGVEVRPIRLLSGMSPFCECFFTDAQADPDNVIGEVDRGWTIAKALLGHERSSIGGEGGVRTTKSLDAIQRRAKAVLGERDGELADGAFRDRLTQLAMDQLCMRYTLQRSGDSARAGHKPGAETSISKLYMTELVARREDLLCALEGPEGTGWEGEGFSAEQLDQTRGWLRARGGLIAGGTSEINLNVIAKRVLGLPD